jgi:hypothetical protein
MNYAVKEIYYTLQGEGANAGRAAVFLRFSGCNLWSGRAEDRGKGPSCSLWCDTDFLGTDGPGGGKFATPRELTAAGRYDTITFAYNFIRRGYEFGLRLIGTLKTDPDMNVLAIYER